MSCAYWRSSRAAQGVHGEGWLDGSPSPTVIATPGENENMEGQLGNGNADNATAAAIVVEEEATTRKRAIAVSISVQSVVR